MTLLVLKALRQKRLANWVAVDTVLPVNYKKILEDAGVLTASRTGQGLPTGLLPP